MVLYYGRNYTASSVGRQIMPVFCEKCRCEYFYELARVGQGAASAPYAIGSGRAEQSASDQARSDLQRRLSDEAELVPCPRCRWINEELIAGYRRGRYRGATKLAFGLGLAGTILSLVVAWCVSLAPVQGRGPLPYFLIGGPAASIMLAVGILVLRYVLRSRIQPNKHYPELPKLPPGSPPALLRNLTTGELEAAPGKSAPEPELDSGSRAGAWLDFQVGRSALKRVCCECLAPSPERLYRRPIRPTVEVVVPICAPCARRWSRRRWRGAAIALALTAAIGLPVLYFMKPDETVFWMAVVGLAIVAPIVGWMIANRLSEPVRVKVVDSSRGVVRLWFRNGAVLKRKAADGMTR